MSIVGLAGPSCSGKTILAHYIAKRLNARIFHLDAYWIKGSFKPIVNGEYSFEQPHQYAGDQMAKDALNFHLKNPGKYIILEGFLLYLYPDLYNLCEHSFFIDVPEKALFERRNIRAAKQGDATGGGKTSQIEKAWLANGISEWNFWGSKQKYYKNISILDGTQSQDDLMSKIMQTININLKLPVQIKL